MSEHYLNMAICPWCGHAESCGIADEPSMGEQTIECRECGREYEIAVRRAVEVEVEIPAEMEACETCDSWAEGCCGYRACREIGLSLPTLENCPQGFGGADFRKGSCGGVHLMSDLYRFPPNAKARAATEFCQAAKIVEEACEAFDAVRDGPSESDILMEAWDAIQAAEGLLRKFDETKVALAYCDCVDKCYERGDYGENEYEHAKPKIEPYSASESAEDPIRAPAHYRGDGEVEAKRAVSSMMAGYDALGVPSEAAWWLGNAVKYIWRHAGKNGAEDLRKAAECVNNAIAAYNAT